LAIALQTGSELRILDSFFLADRLCLERATTSFWMTPKLSSIVIPNLIANLPFFCHNAELWPV
jgi:hypothetical protein